MSEYCECDVHGPSVATIVCRHVVDTLQDGSPRGFDWHVDEDGDYQAVCQTCLDMDADEWDCHEGQLGRVLCFECFRKAALMNGVQIPSAH
jgi:hypothetical protein